jgi:hypothetical protein
MFFIFSLTVMVAGRNRAKDQGAGIPPQGDTGSSGARQHSQQSHGIGRTIFLGRRVLFFFTFLLFFLFFCVFLNFLYFFFRFRFQVVKVALVEDFTVDNGLLTPTHMKNRAAIEKKYQQLLDSMY